MVTVRVWAATVHRVVATDKERVGPGSRVAGMGPGSGGSGQGGGGTSPGGGSGQSGGAAGQAMGDSSIKHWEQPAGVSRRFAYWAGTPGGPAGGAPNAYGAPSGGQAVRRACERQSFFGCGNLYGSGDRQTHSSSASLG